MNTKYMNRLRNVLVILFTIILLNTSCRNIFRKDLSLTPQQYMGQGMPAYTTIWTEKEFQKAQNAINSLRVKYFYSLPRMDSRKSGDMFKRIISKENFAFLNDTSLSLRDRAYRIQSLGNMMGQMGTLYTDKTKVRQYYSEELTEIYVTHLYVRGKMLELAEEIGKSTNQDDIMMQSGRNGIVSSYVLLITFIVSEQEKKTAFAEHDQRRLSKELSNSISENIKYLDSGSKQRIYAVINNSVEKSSSGFTAKNYKDILKLLAD